MSKFNVGDRVTVVAPEITFNDYDAGDTGVVTHVDDGIVKYVKVKWDRRRFDDDTKERERATLLYFREVKVV